VARVVSIKLRRPDFITVSRQRTLAEPTDATLMIWQAAAALLDAWWSQQPGPLRLLGVSVDRAESSPTEASLFDAVPDTRQRALDAIADEAVRRFGPDALRRGGSRAQGRRSRRDVSDMGPRPEAG